MFRLHAKHRIVAQHGVQSPSEARGHYHIDKRQPSDIRGDG
jgi:hypothetical protein